jgi:hypothetical protein
MRLGADKLSLQALKEQKKGAGPKQTKKERGEVPNASKFANVFVNIQREFANVEYSDPLRDYPRLFDAMEEKRFFYWKIVDLNDVTLNTGFRNLPEKSATGNFVHTPVLVSVPSMLV